jgi:hypothetical protein
VPCPDNRNVHKQNTGQFVLDICDNYFKTPISLNELDRTHPIGKVRDGKVQVKVGAIGDEVIICVLQFTDPPQIIVLL